jgi:hypothetical protein
MFSPPLFIKDMYFENLGYCRMGSYDAPKRYIPKIIDCWENASSARLLELFLCGHLCLS